MILMYLLSIQFAYSQSDTVDYDELAYLLAVDSIENSLNYQKGEITLLNGAVKLTVPEGYKFLDSEQSSYVLTDLWGNPPSEVIGLLFPEDVTPLSDNFTYAVELTYSEEGYIEDEDAKDLDYDDLLSEMQTDAKELNPERVKQGYEPVELVGWASEPFYDTKNKKLHWAKELKFGETEINTLNYNIRVLGRKGYLNMNAIGDITVLPIFQEDINKVLSSVDFQEGYKYSDFNPDYDKVAAYGIGGLIAGKILAKAGFFVLIAKFWKIIAVAVIGAIAAFKKRILGRSEG